MGSYGICGRHFRCMGVHWHPECSDDKRVRSQSLTQSCENRPYNKYCYEEFYYPRRDICKHFIPTNEAGLVEYNAHPFWEQKYCPSHEQDCTTMCCERMEQLDAKYLALDDGRKLCPDCLDSATMKSQDCQPRYHEMQEFFQGLRMKVGQQIPILLVESQELNEAMEREKNVRLYIVAFSFP